MALKTSGVMFKQFYNDPAFWPADEGATYHEGEVLVVDGKALEHEDDPGEVTDTAVVEFHDGGVVHGKGAGVGMDAYFKAWLKKQATVTIMVQCDAAVVAAVSAAVRAAGGKVVA